MALSMVSVIQAVHAISRRLWQPAQPAGAPMCIRGRALTMRPVESSDSGRVGDLLRQLSDQTCWLRYRRTRLAVDAVRREVGQLLQRDPARATALVATVQVGGMERAIALAELVAIDDESAEVAIVVREDYQRQGLGRALIRRIVALAQARRLATLQFETRRENAAMHGLVCGLGLLYREQYWRDEVCLRVDLPRTPMPLV